MVQVAAIFHQGNCRGNRLISCVSTSTVMFRAALFLLTQERIFLLKKSLVGIYLFSVGSPIYVYFENRRCHNFVLNIASAVFV